MKNTEARAKLLKLMTKHPDLPVVAMTDSDVVADDSYSWWWSTIGDCGTVSIACWKKPDGEIQWYDDIDDVIEDMMDYYADEDVMQVLTDDQYKAFMTVKAQNLAWRKVIYVDIVSFDGKDIMQRMDG